MAVQTIQAVAAPCAACRAHAVVLGEVAEDQGDDAGEQPQRVDGGGRDGQAGGVLRDVRTHRLVDDGEHAAGGVDAGLHLGHGGEQLLKRLEDDFAGDPGHQYDEGDSRHRQKGPEPGGHVPEAVLGGAEDVVPHRVQDAALFPCLVPPGAQRGEPRFLVRCLRERHGEVGELLVVLARGVVVGLHGATPCCRCMVTERANGPGWWPESGEKGAAAMGWFTRDEPEEIVFDEVIDTDDTIWPAYTDDDGVLWIDVDYDVEVTVNRAIVDGQIRWAKVDDNGRIWIDYDD
ncbi:hypothetical protein [Streptomyces mirabilis]|uniref:hypothetical protein n=1 Tax=Streptomyces mirabilis TaxID=68239 RepID=UPI00380B34BB